MEERILEIASKIFATDITKEAKLGCCKNWDSLGQLNLFMALESELGIKFSSDEVLQTDSIESIIQLVKSKQQNV